MAAVVVGISSDIVVKFVVTIVCQIRDRVIYMFKFPCKGISQTQFPDSKNDQVLVYFQLEMRSGDFRKLVIMGSKRSQHEAALLRKVGEIQQKEAMAGARYRLRETQMRRGENKESYHFKGMLTFKGAMFPVEVGPNCGCAPAI